MGTGSGAGSRDGYGEGGRRGRRELGKLPFDDRSREENQALLFRTPRHLCRKEVSVAGKQQLRAQCPVPVRLREKYLVSGTGMRKG